MSNHAAKWPELVTFRTLLANENVPVPDIIDTALAKKATADAYAANPPLSGLLSGDDTNLRTVLFDTAVRHHASARALGAGLDHAHRLVTDQLWAELLDAVTGLDQVIVALQPAFDAAAAPIVNAAQTYHLSWTTTSDQVILMNNPSAVDAWRAVRTTWPTLARFAAIYRSMNNTFDTHPNADDLTALAFGLDHHGYLVHDPDLSVCFAAGDNWGVKREYYLDTNPTNTSSGIDWLRLAGGGLHLNTPTEVAAKLEQYQATH